MLAGHISRSILSKRIVATVCYSTKPIVGDLLVSEKSNRKTTPDGFNCTYLPKIDAVTLLPSEWHTACEENGESVRYIVSKENAMLTKSYKTGFSISQWLCNEISADLVMEQVATQHFGVIPSMYISQLVGDGYVSPLEQALRNEFQSSLPKQQPHHSITVLSYLKDLNIHVLDYKVNNLPDVLHCKTVEFIKLQRSKELPSDDIYIMSHVVALPTQNSVVSFLFECPVSQYNEYKPVLDTVLNNSVLNYSSTQIPMNSLTLKE